jgi:hypothetical protein
MPGTVAAGTIEVWSDLLCPFAHVLLTRLRAAAVSGSPHLFLPGGGSAHNPGLTVRWEGPWASGYPIAADTDPGWADRLLASAAA